MAAGADYKIYVDWNNDGDFGEADEDISADVKSINIDRGFPGPPPAYCSAASCTLVLLNGSGKYTYENSLSPLHGIEELSQIHPGLLVAVEMDGVRIFTGYLEALTTTVPETLESGEAELVAYGPIGRLEALATVNVPYVENTTVGDEIVRVISAALSMDSSNLTRIDDGQTTLAKHWVNNDIGPLDAINELQDAELGRFYEAKDGEYVYDDRHTYWELGTSTPTAPRSTYGTGLLRMWEPRLENPWPNIYNYIVGRVRTFSETEDMTLATLCDKTTGAGGPPVRLATGTNTLWIELNEKTNLSNIIAVKSWSQIVAPVDMKYFYETINGVPSDDDFAEDVVVLPVEPYGQKLKVVLENNHGSVLYAHVLSARGIGIIEGDGIEVPWENAVSQGRYQKHEYPNASKWLTDTLDAEAYVSYVMDIMAYPRTRISFKIIGNVDQNHLDEISSLEINDKIHIHDPEDASGGTVYGLCVDDDFIVDRIIHSIEPLREGGLHVTTVVCTKVPATKLDAIGTEYPVNISGETGPPDSLYINGADPNGKVVIGVVARKCNQDIYEGELRARFYASNFPEYADLRTVVEGGTLTHNPSNGEIVATGLYADYNGVNYQFTSLGEGRWYYAGRLKNRSFGWSVWTDGNRRPMRVTDWVDTESSMNAETGPPEPDSTVRLYIESGNQAIVKFTRPSRSCTTIFWALCQLLNANTGEWYDLDAEQEGSPADVLYDGSGADHTFDKSNCTLVCNGPDPYPWAGLSEGLVLLDVFNSTDGHTWSVNDCQWGWFGNATGSPMGQRPISGLQFRPYADPDSGQVWEHIRIKIVQAPWNWNSYGYWGAGLAELDFIDAPGAKGNKSTQEFTFPPIPIPAGLTMANLQARVWVENKVCRGLVGTSSGISEDSEEGTPTGAHDLEIITHNEDGNIPVGMMAFRWYRESNYYGIYCAAFWSSTELPAQGPFLEERAAHPSSVLETGLSCQMTAGSRVVTISGRSDQSREGMVLIFEPPDDSDEYEDLDGDYIVTDDGGTVTLGEGWGARWTGTFFGYIIKPWYDVPTNSSNLKYYQFKVPDEIGGDASAEVWQSTPVPKPSGHFYVTGCSRSPYGLGNRLTADSADIGTGAGALCVKLTDAAVIQTNANLAGRYNEKLFTVSVGGDRTLGNPTNALCGQVLKWRITNTSSEEILITLDTKFRRGQTLPAAAQDSATIDGDFYIVDEG